MNCQLISLYVNLNTVIYATIIDSSTHSLALKIVKKLITRIRIFLFFSSCVSFPFVRRINSERKSHLTCLSLHEDVYKRQEINCTGLSIFISERNLEGS